MPDQCDRCFLKIPLFLLHFLTTYLDSFSKHNNEVSFYIFRVMKLEIISQFYINYKNISQNIHFSIMLSQYFYTQNNERNQL